MRYFLLLVGLLAASFANPVVSEFMADNAGVIVDEDGAASDWIEIHNPTTSPISLGSYCLTDELADPTKWRFPVQSLEPGGFLVVWASAKNRAVAGAPLHTNFSLSKNGEFLALVHSPLPTGPTANLQSWNPFPAQDPNESFGLQFTSTTLVGAGASARYFVPPNGSLGTSWTGSGFSDGAWSSGPTGLGFGLLVPGILVRQVNQNGAYGTVNSVAATDLLLSVPPGDPRILAEAKETVSTVNYLGENADGHYGGNRVLPTGILNSYAVHATGYVSIPAAGNYTFGLNSDDGGRIKIDGNTVMLDDSNHGPQDHLGSVFLTVGLHAFDVIMWEANGGDEVEFYAGAGVSTAWNSAMRLVGDSANGGLEAFTVPSGTGSNVVATNIEPVMKNVNATCYVRVPFNASGLGGFTSVSLRMRFNDGYAAYLNGTPIAAVNQPGALAYNSAATASRTDAETLVPVAANVTAFLPQMLTGNNILAIHGMNSTAANSTFLVLPELIAGTVNAGAQHVFFAGSATTPGSINGAYSLLGKVEDTQFSHQRGFFTAPFSLSISTITPGATIRYTTDASTPTATTGSVYTSPIPITATTVIRAAAFKTGYEPTNVDTQTYLFLNDVITQSANGLPPPGWPATSETSQVLDYGMDPDIVNHSNPDVGGAASVKAALTAVSTVCITTPLPNLFNIGGSQGIYSNPGGRGFAWERPATIEIIKPPDALNPNGSTEVNIDCGIRMRGGFSRDPSNPKHSWHLFFRTDYGAGKLNHPLFGRHGADEFDQLDFRTAQNYSWSFGGDGNNTFLREESTRLAQRDMGHQYGRLRYFHLYINGIYWGLYNTEERTEASYGETYFGGAKDDYDVVKGEQDSGYITGVTDGNLAAWQDLWNKSKAHLASPTATNYFKMMGLAADGVTPTADPVLLDVDSLIDYMLLTFWTGNLDGSTSAFLGNNNSNNWFGMRNRLGTSGGFQFFAHDFEHTFFNTGEDRTGPYTNADYYGSFTYSSPMYLHQDLSANTEYRIRWADRVHKHMFNNGALTQPAWNNRINGIATIVDQTIIAESARWGDAKAATPFTRQSWINAQNYLLGSYVPVRGAVVVSQLRADSLYPTLDAPTVAPFGGYQESGVEAAMTAPGGGIIYYMPDGTDPRVLGGAIRPGALSYSSSTTVDVLVPLSAPSWKYLADGTNQGTAWRAVGFNDTAWPGGAAQLGYGDNDEVTVIPSQPSGSRYATTYFRRAFTASNVAGITSLSLHIEYDDAAIVYINGQFAGLAGNITQNAAYDHYTGDAIEQTAVDLQISPSLIVNGANTVAVEIHQANNTSSDISMNLSLTATRSSTATPLFLTGNGVRPLRARAYNAGTWSALTDATFLLNTETARTANLVITEIMYHPAEPSPAEIAAGFVDADDFEFLEITNIGAKHVDLEGVYLYGPIDFDFTGATTGRILAPGASVIIAARKSAFQFRYGAGLPVAGSYKGSLDNAGEALAIYTPGEATIRSFAYDDAAPWPVAADGQGYSLIRKLPSSDGAADSTASNWRISTTVGGNPGTTDASTFAGWKTTNSVTDDNSDTDKDGIAAKLEYVLGGSAAASDLGKLPVVAIAPLTVLGVTQNYVTIAFTRRAGADDATFAVEGDDLTGGWDASATVLHSVMSAGAGLETVVFRSVAPFTPVAGGSEVYRLKATIAQ